MPVRGHDSLLVPLDFGDVNHRIIEAALRIRSDAGTVHLLHVVEWLPAVTESTFGVYAHRKDIEKIKALARRKLQSVAASHPDVPMEVHVHEGKPAAGIVAAAADIGAEVVVMGTHGRSGLDHFLVGSVAERVMRRAPCHVLLVRFEDARATR